MTRERASTPPSGAPRVLDASAVLSGVPVPRDRPLAVPGAVLGEVERRGRDRRQLEYLLDTGLVVRDPTPSFVDRVEEAATRTGDHRRLSAVDREVLALALELGGEVVTDDYSIQNVATVLGVPFRPVLQKGITEVFRWTVRCIGCRKTFEREVTECDVCGSPVKTVRAR